MNPTPQHVQRIYLSLTLLNTLAASFIWGINTLFLLSAGLSNLEAFAANAFFTAGQVLFEVPTGIVADMHGRRRSYILGTIVLGISTLLYLWAWHVHAPFWVWAATSVFLGLGFTFFSGATDAWLVDALNFTGFKDNLENVFSKGQIVSGAAMLTGSVAGGLIAQATNLGVPYIVRAAILGINCLVALFFMKDLGFSPKPSVHLAADVKKTFTAAVDHGLRNSSVRWIMLAAPFGAGVGFYAFYAMQPYLLKLWGNEQAYWIAGLAAAIVAGAQILGGLLVPYFRFFFNRRTKVLIGTTLIGAVLLAGIGFASSFWVAILFLVLWALCFAAATPVRQAYLNGLIPSQQRATVLSFDSLMGSSGGVVIQPALGKAADVWSYSVSYGIGAVISLAALPFFILARRENPSSDEIK